jgi:hypothetical protein
MSMPVIQKENVLAANEVKDNVLSGSAFEFARQNQLVSIGCCASATGAFVTITSGADVVLEESPIVIKAANAWPIIPDEMYYSDIAAMGDRLVIRVRNTSGTPTVHTIVQVTPV